MIDLNINIETVAQLVVGVGSAVLAVLLMLIKIPTSDYSEKLAKSKMAIITSFLICSFMMFYGMSQYDEAYIWDWSLLMMLVIYIVVHFSTVIISYSMIALLKTEKKRYQNLYALGLFVSGITSFMLLQAYKSDNTNYFWGMCIAALTIFLIQSVTYIVYFDKAYKQSLKDFETYYDDDADHKLKWVRFCYAFSMLTNIFIIVYLGIYWASEYKMAIAGIYTLWYLLYMLYLSSNFISFLGSHKLVLDAFAYKTLSGQDLMRRLDENRKRKALKTRKKGETEEFVLQDNTEAEFKRLERALEHWVEAKRFREYDRTRDEIASELHTSKEALHMYFATRVGVDFRTWRTSLRIAEAKNLLLENKDASINIIAEACGFSDKSNFHRQFVKIVGCSPKEWRDSSGNYTR